MIANVLDFLFISFAPIFIYFPNISAELSEPASSVAILYMNTRKKWHLKKWLFQADIYIKSREFPASISGLDYNDKEYTWNEF